MFLLGMLGRRLIFWEAAVVVLFALSACHASTEETAIGEEFDEDYGRKLVVSELMTHNVTTVIDASGKPSDWVELQNISDDDISLKDYMLYATAETDTLTTSEKKASLWKFPDCQLAAGQYLLVFVGDKDGKVADELKATLKLPAKSGCVKVLTPEGRVLGEMPYDKLNADESLQRQADSTFTKSLQPTPGFPNTDAGWEAFLSARDKQGDALKIWEVKPNGEAKDQWVEVKNTSNKTINLKDYSLTNKVKKTDRWQFPDVKLAPGDFYCVQTVGKRRAAGNAKLANFKVSDREVVFLAKKGKIVDALSTSGTLPGCSRGRVKDKAGWFYFENPTQQAENAKKSYRNVATVPVLKQKPGVYEERELEVEIETDGRKVHYTTDGSLPTKASRTYKQPIRLTKTTMLRYFAEGDENTLHSDVASCTYLLGEKHTLPVLHVTMRESDLFSPSSGIYVEGNRPPDIHKVGDNIEENRNANYFQNWVKPAYVEFFDGKEGFSAHCGIKIFGAGSRALPKKSFSLKFDLAYGPASVTYDFFDKGKPMELQDIVIRSGSDDQQGSMMRDEFFTSLMQAESPTMLTQFYRPVVLYINGKYWGLYYLREKIDRHFVGRKLGVSDDSVTILRAQAAELGSPKEFYALHSYLNSHDCRSAETFKYMDEHVCLTSLIDGKIGRLYCGDTDIYNVRQVKAADAKGDQKWYWVFYDVDNAWYTFMSTAFYLRAHSAYSGPQPVGFCNLMIDRMLSNPQFRELFLQRLSHHMKHTFSIENVTSKFDALTETIRPEMERNCNRWSEIMTYQSWEGRVRAFRKRFETRAQDMLDGIKKEIGITAEECQKYGL